LLDHGDQWIGKTLREECLRAIQAHDPNVQMLLAGFIGQAAVLFQLWEDVEICTNFAAIGTGASTAIPALHARTQSFNGNIETALYNVYEAKKLGESSPYVGEKTGSTRI
ncbi:MAG: hypothetical protein Q8O70_12825, partial [Burkholderiales bacterium]|nr:hypothetical protein [Burkholderiales bacterium]